MVSSFWNVPRFRAYHEIGPDVYTAFDNDGFKSYLYDTYPKLYRCLLGLIQILAKEKPGPKVTNRARLVRKVILDALRNEHDVNNIYTSARENMLTFIRYIWGIEADRNKSGTRQFTDKVSNAIDYINLYAAAKTNEYVAETHNKPIFMISYEDTFADIDVSKQKRSAPIVPRLPTEMYETIVEKALGTDLSTAMSLT